MVPVGIRGFGGSPPLTSTRSGLSTPPPQAATGETASNTATTARVARIRRMTATILAPAAPPSKAPGTRLMVIGAVLMAIGALAISRRRSPQAISGIYILAS
ncbi:hypothetical protein NJB18091_30510 [Mycobacterium marinum]|nr:hypothetical protein NJB18091_30510 [Mycobacterium marinum]